MRNIKIRGARTHNLKNINLDIPRDRLVVITGLSGSGKSSLAFDTLYAEGQRRYVESLSAYARQFLSMMEKPDVDLIEGLSPAISIEQKTTSNNPRSTVGTITEIYDYLRVLFARIGEPRCPQHHTPLRAQTVMQIVDMMLALPEDSKIMILAPVVEARKGEYQQLFKRLITQGYLRARVNGEIIELDTIPKLNAKQKHTVEVVIDRLKINPTQSQRLADSCETALKMGDGKLIVASMDDSKKPDIVCSSKHACIHCGYSLPELEPRLFSFNSPQGACTGCDGLGEKEFVDLKCVVVQPELSLSAGAIRGWGRDYFHYFQILQALSKHYDFSVDDPYSKIPADIQRKILFGTGSEKIKMSWFDSSGKKQQQLTAFEGVIPYIERRYHTTQSVAVREDLQRYFSQQPCPECEGTRLKTIARNVFINGFNLPQITALPIMDALNWFQQLQLTGQNFNIANKLLKEIKDRLTFLVNVGLDYLSLNRSAQTLSGGEAQRIRLASQIGSGLMGVMYVLDEPSIGLHQRDNQRLLKTLFHLRDLGNTVIVVEHDEEAILAADYVIDMGPGAGIHGGDVVVEGTPQQIQEHPHSLTGHYLSGQQCIEVPQHRIPRDPERVLRIFGASGNNLKHVDVEFPLGLFIAVTGVSGSGKSTLVNDTLYPLAAIALNGATLVSPAEYLAVEGMEHLDKVINIDQSPIGRTPRSNPATYTGIFTIIRDLFSALPESKSRAYEPGRFSFNVPGGRCEACEGDGVIKVEMHFIADVYVTCDQCQGKRYNRETLEILYKGKNIHEVLQMTVEESLNFFHAIPPLARKLQTLIDVGLSYIQLGQSATTMSGGEAQRIKLAKELSKRDTGRTLYLLDEPTTGLHFHDVAQLLKVLHRLRGNGNTILVIEHHLDVIKTADWIIDMGPEGGMQGGTVVAAGTPEQVAQHPTSYTGKFLAPLLNKAQHSAATVKQKGSPKQTVFSQAIK